jgi:hypothetical protein
MPTPTWPDDNIERQTSFLSSSGIQLISSFVSVFMYNDQLMFAGEQGFDTEDVKKVKILSEKYDLSKLNFERYPWLS